MPEVPGRPEALAGERGQAGTAGAAAAVVSSALDVSVSVAALGNSGDLPNFGFKKSQE